MTQSVLPAPAPEVAASRSNASEPNIETPKRKSDRPPWKPPLIMWSNWAAKAKTLMGAAIVTTRQPTEIVLMFSSCPVRVVEATT